MEFEEAQERLLADLQRTTQAGVVGPMSSWLRRERLRQSVQGMLNDQGNGAFASVGEAEGGKYTVTITARAPWLTL